MRVRDRCSDDGVTKASSAQHGEVCGRDRREGVEKRAMSPDSVLD